MCHVSWGRLPAAAMRSLEIAGALTSSQFSDLNRENNLGLSRLDQGLGGQSGFFFLTPNRGSYPTVKVNSKYVSDCNFVGLSLRSFATLSPKIESNFS